MTDLPEPLAPADCDLRGYEFMPVFGHRLFGSVFYARASDAEFRAAMRLWWAAWQQCPAGSLPADDAALALLADFGRDLKGWSKVREVALHGFVRCNDGRLYHPLLCEEARSAYERRKRERDRKRAFRSKDTASGGEGQDAENPRPSNDQSASCPAGHPSEREGTGQDRTGQDRTVREKEKIPKATPSAPAEPSREPDSIRSSLWSEGLERLRRITGKPDKAARALLGEFCRDAGDDCALVAGLLFDAERDKPGDPVAWVGAAIQRHTGRRPGAARSEPPSKLAWMLNDGGNA